MSEQSPQPNPDPDDVPSLEEIKTSIRGLGRDEASLVAFRAAWRVMPLLLGESGDFAHWEKKNRNKYLEAIQAAALVGLVGRRHAEYLNFSAAAAYAAAAADAAAAAAYAAYAADAAAAAAYAAYAAYAADAAAAAAYAAYAADAAAAAAAYAADAAAADDAAAAAAYAAAYAAAAADASGETRKLQLLKQIQLDISSLSEPRQIERLERAPIWDESWDWRSAFLMPSWESGLRKLGTEGVALWERWRRFAYGKGSPQEAADDINEWYALRNKNEQSATPPKKKPRATKKTKAEPEPEPEPEPENTFVHSIFASQDAVQHPDQDALGYQKVARAVKAFITDEETRLPLTLSVEGEWGTGKSSFMGLLKRDLDIPGADGSSGFLSVWFNPWRYETVEAMWAALAISMTDQLKQGLSFGKRIGIWWNIFQRRFKQRCKLFAWIRTVLLALLATIVGLVVVGFGLVDKDFVVLPAIVAIFYAANKVFASSGSSIADDLKGFFEEPNYAEQATVLQRFHTDLRYIMMACVRAHRPAGDRPLPKIALFIDDLDRCEVPIASEVLRSLNLFFATDQDESFADAENGDVPKIVCLLGMDREKVAASIAAQHEKILPWLEAPSGREGSGSKRSDGLRFGYRYLEKFIHVTLMLPSPGRAQMKDFLDRLCGPIVEKASVLPKIGEEDGNLSLPGDDSLPDQPIDPATPDPLPTPPVAGDPGVDMPSEEAIAAARQEVQATETELVRRCAELAAPALGFNPRRLKQFVNLYRLRIRLAVELGVYRHYREQPVADMKILTLEQIGRLVAIELASPVLTLQIRGDSRFFEKDRPRNAHYINSCERNPGLGSLLEDVPRDVQPDDHWRWNLATVDLVRYAEIGLPSTGTMRNTEEA